MNSEKNGKWIVQILITIHKNEWDQYEKYFVGVSEEIHQDPRNHLSYETYTQLYTTKEQELLFVCNIKLTVVHCLQWTIQIAYYGIARVYYRVISDTSETCPTSRQYTFSLFALYKGNTSLSTQFLVHNEN